MLEIMSLLSLSLMARAIGINPYSKNFDTVVKKVIDRQQDMTAKVSKLLHLQRRLNRRLRAMARRVGFGNVYSKNRNVVMKKNLLAKGEGVVIEASKHGNSIYIPSMGKIFVGQASENGGHLRPVKSKETVPDTVRTEGIFYPPAHSSYQSIRQGNEW